MKQDETFINLTFINPYKIFNKFNFIYACSKLFSGEKMEKRFFIEKLNKIAMWEYQVNIDCCCSKDRQAEGILQKKGYPA